MHGFFVVVGDSFCRRAIQRGRNGSDFMESGETEEDFSDDEDVPQKSMKANGRYRSFNLS